MKIPVLEMQELFIIYSHNLLPGLGSHWPHHETGGERFFLLYALFKEAIALFVCCHLFENNWKSNASGALPRYHDVHQRGDKKIDFSGNSHPMIIGGKII